MMRTGNPVLHAQTFRRVGTGLIGDRMTINGEGLPCSLHFTFLGLDQSRLLIPALRGYKPGS